MRFLHQVIELAAGQAVEVRFTPVGANVLLLDSVNFLNYQTGATFQYLGGHFTTPNPVFLKPDRPGTWHLVVDRRTGDQRVSATYKVLNAPMMATTPSRYTT